VNAQSADLSNEQQNLLSIAGSWTVDGSETTYIEICDWIQGNHLQCHSTDTESGIEKKSISYFTYSKLEKVYIYYGLYSGGSSRTLRGHWLNNQFVFEGQHQADNKTTRYKVTMTPTTEKIHFKEERAIDNEEWKEIANFYYKKVK